MHVARRLTLAALVWLCSAGAATCAESKLRDRWFASASSINSYDAYGDFESKILRDGKYFVTSKHKFRFRYRSGMWRIDHLEVNKFFVNSEPSMRVVESPNCVAYAYDGGLIRFLDTERNFSEIVAEAPYQFNRAKLLGTQPFEI